MKTYALVATHYKKRKMLAPMYFMGDLKRIKLLKNKGYNIMKDVKK